jgi:hypothetical protein
VKAFFKFCGYSLEKEQSKKVSKSIRSNGAVWKIALGIFIVPSSAQKEVRGTMTHHIDHNVHTMTECHDICLQTVSHCLDKGGEHARTEHITLLLDCAEICQTAANFILRNSELHARVCAVCAEVCDRCAEECERLAAGDNIMQRSTQTCRTCAEACREMSRHSGRPSRHRCLSRTARGGFCHAVRLDQPDIGTTKRPAGWQLWKRNNAYAARASKAGIRRSEWRGAFSNRATPRR